MRCTRAGRTPPGLSASLPEFREFLGPYARTAEEGVDTIVWLAASEEAGRSTGGLFLDRRRARSTGSR